MAFMLMLFQLSLTRCGGTGSLILIVGTGIGAGGHLGDGADLIGAQAGDHLGAGDLVGVAVQDGTDPDGVEDLVGDPHGVAMAVEIGTDQPLITTIEDQIIVSVLLLHALPLVVRIQSELPHVVVPLQIMEHQQMEVVPQQHLVG